jgi:hypothetical protein
MPLKVSEARAAAATAVEARTKVRRRRKGDMVFGAPLADGITLWAWVEITRGQGDESTGANLWVGVRHHALEQIVSQASGYPDSGSGTIIHPVFELIADARTYMWWPLHEETLEADAARLAGDLADPGLAWASRLDSLDAIVEALRDAYRSDLAWWRLPAALLLLGRDAEAEAYVAEAAQLHSRSGVGEPGELTAYWRRLTNALDRLPEDVDR